MTTTSQAMSQFLTDITITEYQKTSIVEQRKNCVLENLTDAFPSTSDLPFDCSYLMGSAAKGTIVRPMDDIDVLAVFSNANGAWDNRYRWDSQAFLYRIRQAYAGLSTAQVGARGQAVRVFFQGGGFVDVAPVFSYGEGRYALPKGDGDWITTTPLKANAWFKEQNKDLSYHLAPLVRLLKKWNSAHSKRFRSFHLETVAAHTFSQLSGNRQTGLSKFFEWAPKYLDVSDPGGESGSLSGYLTWSARSALETALNSAHEKSVKALSAEADGDHAEAKRLWKIILGSSFPA